MKERKRLPDAVLLERMTKRRWIDPATDCWIFTGGKQRHGYGSLWDGRRTATVSRLSAEIYLNLPLDSRLFVLHRCDVPACFNPAHLFFGDQADNWRDCQKKGRAYQLPPRTHEQAGEQNSQAKLTWGKVARIRKLGPFLSQGEIAREFGITQPLVSMILNKVIWKTEVELH